jgi:hypothetical protein
MNPSNIDNKVILQPNTRNFIFLVLFDGFIHNNFKNKNNSIFMYFLQRMKYPLLTRYNTIQVQHNNNSFCISNIKSEENNEKCLLVVNTVGGIIYDTPDAIYNDIFDTRFPFVLIPFIENINEYDFISLNNKLYIQEYFKNTFHEFNFMIDKQQNIFYAYGKKFYITSTGASFVTAVFYDNIEFYPLLFVIYDIANEVFYEIYNLKNDLHIHFGDIIHNSAFHNVWDDKQYEDYTIDSISGFSLNDDDIKSDLDDNEKLYIYQLTETQYKELDVKSNIESDPTTIYIMIVSSFGVLYFARRDITHLFVYVNSSSKSIEAKDGTVVRKYSTLLTDTHNPTKCGSFYSEYYTYVYHYKRYLYNTNQTKYSDWSDSELREELHTFTYNIFKLIIDNFQVCNEYVLKLYTNSCITLAYYWIAMHMDYSFPCIYYIKGYKRLSKTELLNDWESILSHYRMSKQLENTTIYNGKYMKKPYLDDWSFLCNTHIRYVQRENTFSFPIDYLFAIIPIELFLKSNIPLIQNIENNYRSKHHPFIILSLFHRQVALSKQWNCKPYNDILQTNIAFPCSRISMNEDIPHVFLCEEMLPLVFKIQLCTLVCKFSNRLTVDTIHILIYLHLAILGYQSAFTFTFDFDNINYIQIRKIEEQKVNDSAFHVYDNIHLMSCISLKYKYQVDLISNQCKFFESIFQEDHPFTWLVHIQYNIYKGYRVTNAFVNKSYDLPWCIAFLLFGETYTNTYKIPLEFYFDICVEISTYMLISHKDTSFNERLYIMQKDNIFKRNVPFLELNYKDDNLCVDNAQRTVHVKSEQIIVEYDENTDLVYFTDIECIHRPGCFLTLVVSENKWYTDITKQYQVHLDSMDDDVLCSRYHGFYWGLSMLPVIDTKSSLESKPIGYLLIRPNKDHIDMENRICGIDSISMIHNPESNCGNVFIYVWMKGNTHLVCTSKYDLSLLLILSIISNRHDVYARLYPQLRCIDNINPIFLDPTSCDFPTLPDQNTNMNYEDRGYDDYSFPILQLDRPLFPIDLQTSANETDLCAYTKRIFEYTSGKIVTEDQYNLFKLILERMQNFQVVPMEISMRMGKTSVLLPMITLHTLMNADDKNSSAIVVVPNEELMDQTFRRFMEGMGWVGVIQVRRTNGNFSDILRYENKPLVIICTHTCLYLNVINQTFNTDKQRPILVMLDEYDAFLKPPKFSLNVDDEDTIEYCKEYIPPPNEDVISFLLNMHLSMSGYTQSRLQRKIQDETNDLYKRWYIALLNIKKLEIKKDYGAHETKLYAVLYGTHFPYEEFQDMLTCVIATINVLLLEEKLNAYQETTWATYLKEHPGEMVPQEWSNITFKFIRDIKFYKFPKITNVKSYILYIVQIVIPLLYSSKTYSACTLFDVLKDDECGIRKINSKTHVLAMSGTLDNNLDIMKNVLQCTIFEDGTPSQGRAQSIALLAQSNKYPIGGWEQSLYFTKIQELMRTNTYEHYAIIDVGGLTKSSKKNLDVIKEIMTSNVYFRDIFTHVLYPDEDNETSIYNISTNTYMTYNGLKPGKNNKWLYYFGPMHCRGYDVPMKFDDDIVSICGFVIVSSSNTQHEVMHAINRLRYILDAETKQKILLLHSPSTDICTLLHDNQVSASKEQERRPVELNPGTTRDKTYQEDVIIYKATIPTSIYPWLYNIQPFKLHLDDTYGDNIIYIDYKPGAIFYFKKDASYPHVECREEYDDNNKYGFLYSSNVMLDYIEMYSLNFYDCIDERIEPQLKIQYVFIILFFQAYVTRNIPLFKAISQVATRWFDKLFQEATKHNSLGDIINNNEDCINYIPYQIMMASLIEKNEMDELTFVNIRGSSDY